MNEILVGVISSAVQLQGVISSAESMEGSFSNYSIPTTDYDGSYSFTPTQEAQTIPTQYKTLAADITINPIPSNYGLITWDGSTLTVS